MTRTIQRIFAATSIICVVFLVGLYVYRQSSDFREGPVIDVTSPASGVSSSEEVAVIEGTAKHIADISLNDHPIYIDERGFFREKIMLLPGYNAVTIKAKDRFGKQAVKIIELVYKTHEPEAETVTLETESGLSAN